jgi:hypothetical protein
MRLPLRPAKLDVSIVKATGQVIEGGTRVSGRGREPDALRRIVEERREIELSGENDPLYIRVLRRNRFPHLRQILEPRGRIEGTDILSSMTFGRSRERQSTPEQQGQ